ncbi:hypothetical protein [Amycolatopsis sp. SID8362]|uniref:hypothetical protein n=1 Tax=Amycolatopsis sp. SID8362 TaxID=2690346 RepID=UPI001368785D|nr:hypothetical protein [Amycolatopsis sp. SID8362]NBH04622.1 hypothetical protein [Amycolatopsis sp. SID8362]NED41321.1 hypothetical protein [Amycolatopsis sp. SID8362]
MNEQVRMSKKRRGRRSVAGVCLASLGLVGAAAPPAHADGNDGSDRMVYNQLDPEHGRTVGELLSHCESGRDQYGHKISCTAGRPVKGERYDSPRRVVGDMLYNCTDLPADTSVSWSETVGQTNFLGAEAGVAVEANAVFYKVSAKITATFGTTWGESRTTAESTAVKAGPRQAAWVERSVPMQRFGSTITVTDQDQWQNDKVTGKYEFIAGVGAPVPGAAGNTSTHTRPMTQAELDSCPRDPAGAAFPAKP